MTFIEAIQKWKEWCQEMLATSTERLEFARTMPEGLEQDGNVLFDKCGLVYRRMGDTLEYIERADKNDPWSRYTKTGYIEAKFGGYRDGVEVFKTGPYPHEELVLTRGEFTDHRTWARMRYGSTVARYETTVAYNRRGVELADQILGKADEVTEWMAHWALASDRTNLEMIDLDWTMLATRFGLSVSMNDVPDCGSIMCSLHAELDKLGGHENIRGYAC